ncbi:MAG: sigma-70 family RNA polymerase sigma factor [Proteobacteria bacterium]|nr:sigma-70 family RNA polymerase sigma factor [Pseudomonadota bacterium]
MARSRLNTIVGWKDQSLEYSFNPGDGSLKAEEPVGGEKAPEKTDDILWTYLREVAHYPLLTPKQEIKLGREIRACQERLVVLMLRLPLVFREIDELKASIKAGKRGKKNEKKFVRPKEDLIEEILWRLRAMERESPMDRSLQALLNKIHQVEARLRNVSARMILSNLRLVFSISRNFLNRGLPLLDLIQEGNIGLLKVVARFDPDRGHRFSTYATWWIRQGIQRGIEEKGRTIRIPANTLDALNRYRRVMGSSVGASGENTLENVVEKARLSLKRLGGLPDHVEEPISLEIPMGNGKERLIDLVPDTEPQSPTDVVMQNELSKELRKTLRKMLSPREEKIIKQRFGIDDKREYTLGELGRQLGISRERVRQIQNKALKKLESVGKENRLREFDEP